MSVKSYLQKTHDELVAKNEWLESQLAALRKAGDGLAEAIERLLDVYAAWRGERIQAALAAWQKARGDA